MADALRLQANSNCVSHGVHDVELIQGGISSCVRGAEVMSLAIDASLAVSDYS